MQIDNSAVKMTESFTALFSFHKPCMLRGFPSEQERNLSLFPDGKGGIRGFARAAEEDAGIRAEAMKHSRAAFLRHKGEGL